MYRKMNNPNINDWVFVTKLSQKSLSCLSENQNDDFVYFELIPNEVYAKVEFPSGNVSISGKGSNRMLLQHAKTFDYNISNKFFVR